MKKIFILLAMVGLFFFSNLAFGQQNYLIKIDLKTQQDIDKIKGTDIKVYAKTQNFFVAEADEENLNWLKTSGISYQILDEELEVYDYYLVYPRANEQIPKGLPLIKGKSSVLTYEDDVAIVKGNPRKIQELASEGFGLRKIQKKALPLEDNIFAKSYLQSFSPAYDPLIDSIIHKVSQTQALSWVDDLSGENPVIIGGFEDTIRTRYSLSPGVFKAANYLKERFEEMGISAEFDTFKTAGFPVYLMNVSASPDGQKAWAASYWGGIVKTVDGGNSWDSIPGTESFPLWGIDRVTDDILWAVGDFGTIVRSTDFGNTWEDKTIDSLASQGYAFRGCYFENRDTGWVVGDYRIIYTEDGGNSWTLQKTASYRLYGIDFIDQNEGWVVGSGGTIYHTTNRGTIWNSQTSGTSASLRDVQFLSASKGWVCGGSGMVRFTINGGTNWTQKNLGSTTTFNGLCFADTLKGWIVGFDGSIYHTLDGGNNWGTQQSHTNYLYGVDFSDTLTGWAVGYQEIIKTTDGGAVYWFSQYTNLEPIELVNVVGTIPGKGNPGRQCLITGHYDDISQAQYRDTLAPGADDNASGTQTILAAASILKDYNLNNTVKFIGFSGEEQGLLGSAAYAQKADDRNDTIIGVLNFDMIAWDGNKDNVMEVHCGSPAQNQALADLFIGVLADYGIPLTPQKIISGTSGGSDHASFWDHNFPAILGIEDFQDFNAYYHTTGDRISVFDTSYFVDFTKAAVGSIAILAEPYIVGDTDKDRKIDLTDVILLAYFILKSGTPPNPLIAGDVDCDGNLDLADVIYLANYLLKSGPDLCPP